MGEIIIFICDWCGQRHDDQQLPPTVKGWALTLDPMTKLQHGPEGRHSKGGKVVDIYLYPPEMRVEPTETQPFHYETTLCPSCVGELQAAVKHVRIDRKKGASKK